MMTRASARVPRALRLASAFAIRQAEDFLAHGDAPHREHGFCARVQGYCFALNDTGWEYAGYAGDALGVAVLVCVLSRLAGFDSGRESSGEGGE